MMQVDRSSVLRKRLVEKTCGCALPARCLRLPALVCNPSHQLVRRREGALYGIMADLGRDNAVSNVLFTVEILA